MYKKGKNFDTFAFSKKKRKENLILLNQYDSIERR